MPASSALARESQVSGHDDLAAAYVAGFREAGVRTLIRNLTTSVEARRIGGRLVPVTINRSEPTDTYVCSPHTAFVRYLREEIPALPLPALHRPLDLLVSGFDALLRAGRIDDIVHLNNWMLSTNLNAGLAIPEPARLANDLAEEFPHSVIALRSLNAWADRDLIGSLGNAGWHLLPSRQVWIVEEFARDWQDRRDTKRDKALALSTDLVREELRSMTDADARRIAELYRLLYLDKYSRLNPDYAPAFIRLTQRIGMIRYLVFRDQEGVIQSVAGCFVLGDEVTTPIVGYDTSKPAEDGLYRLATLAIFEFAKENGLRLNLSSGAASFKRNRGARAEIEYTALYIRHMSAPRRAAIGALRQTLMRIGVPMLRRYQL